MITSNCSELGAPNFLIRALFHFTWQKGGDGGKVTPVSVEPIGVQALKNPNPLEDVEALVVLAVAVLV